MISTDTEGNSEESWTLSIPASQIVNLIQHFLTENGLKDTSSALLTEAKIGCRGLLSHAHSHIMRCCKDGNWGNVLDTLSILTLNDGDESHAQNDKHIDKVLAEVHEMAILELAENGEMDLAFGTLKICREMLDKPSLNEKEEKINPDLTMDGILSKSVERKLHALNAMPSNHAQTAQDEVANNVILLPTDYYGPNNLTKEERRKKIAKCLGDAIPIIPSSRLVSLCQQAIKWQMHTGSMPMMKEFWRENENQSENERDQNGHEKKKRKKTKHQRHKKRFDLVMGNVNDISSNEPKTSSSVNTKSSKVYENVPLDVYSKLKFGKKTTVTSCTFFTDVQINQTSLITGTSDGFIEIWDESSKFTKLREDLEYQKKEELMCHDGSDDNEDPPMILAMVVNPEGTMLCTGDSIGSIYVWDIQKGSCLCSLSRVHGGAITCLEFSSDGSRILSGSQDGSCREFGLRAKRMLKEFRGHTSFVNCCRYFVPGKSSNQGLLVVTASADSTVRVWCGKSAEEKYVLNPMNSTGPSAVVSLTSSIPGEADQNYNIHTVIPLHTPANTMIIVPRGHKAYLVTLSGLILRTFENESVATSNENGSPQKGEFVTGTISPSNKWLYLVTGLGVCICFDVATGAVEDKINDFGLETVGGKAGIEISGLIHHPLKGVLVSYSSSKAQKKGLLTVWK